MYQLQRVIWSKGTFLTPQHLQTQDRFIEGMLQFQLQALRAFTWGFTRLTIDQDRLAEGQIAISDAAGIFPDGLAFDIPNSDPAPGSRVLTEYFEPGQDTLDVYLAIPDYRQRGINVSTKPDGASRYRADVTMFRDENTGIGEKPVQVARKNLRLLVEGESREGSTVLKIANVQRTDSGALRLGAQFVPPLLDIAASEYAGGILRGILEVLVAKSTALSTTRRQKNQSLADFTASDIANFWLLYAINSHFPLLKHLFDSGHAHPEEMYEAMASLAGTLTTFSNTVHPRDLPAYDHENLGPVLAQLDQKLRLLLETVVPTHFKSLPLKLVERSVYATALDDDKYLHGTKMYLAVAADVNEGDLIKGVPRLAKVCSATHIDTLVKQALPGMQITHLPAPPTAIPVKLNYQYFSLNQAGGAWEAVCRARNLAVYMPSEFANPQMELIILLPQAS
ncbi:MAG TPA: type VI secretion system baseplate subunit TssK [Terriglobales bacterium]|nr:type VI secretion system baseplate subunit TssK [Terriglobales bacterium]